MSPPITRTSNESSRSQSKTRERQQWWMTRIDVGSRGSEGVYGDEFNEMTISLQHWHHTSEFMERSGRFKTPDRCHMSSSSLFTAALLSAGGYELLSHYTSQCRPPTDLQHFNDLLQHRGDPETRVSASGKHTGLFNWDENVIMTQLICGNEGFNARAVTTAYCNGDKYEENLQQS